MVSLPHRPPPAHIVEDAVSNHDTVESVADTLQTLLKGAEAIIPAGVLDLLHGEPVGHPIHPLLVHVPLGGWVIAAALDHLPAKAPGGNDHAADPALTLGTLGAGATIGIGCRGYLTARGEAQRSGLIHGALSETAFLLNVGSL